MNSDSAIPLLERDEDSTSTNLKMIEENRTLKERLGNIESIINNNPRYH